MKLNIISLVLLFFMLNISAQEKQKMNLQQLLKFATENNYELKEARFNRTKSALSIKETRANGLPKVDAEVDYKNYLSMPTMILPGELSGVPGAPDIETEFGKTHNMDISLQYSQLLFSLKYINSVKTTQKVLEIRELEIEKSEEELVQLLYSEYYNLLAIYKNLDIINSNMESLQLNRNNIASMLEGGLALQTDVDKIDVNYANLEANKESVLAGINVQTNNIKYVIGMEWNIKLEIDTTGFSQEFSNELFIDRYSSDVFDAENLIEIGILNKNLELNEFEIKMAKSELTPTLALYGSYMYQLQRDQLNLFDKDESWYNVNVIGIKATIPVFAGFGKRAKISNAKIDQVLTQNKLDKARQGLSLQYQNALMTYQTSMKNCLIQHKNVELSLRVKKQEELKYKEGIGTLTDYLISESDYRNAQINFVRNFLTMKKSEINLLKAKGLLRPLLVQVQER